MQLVFPHPSKLCGAAAWVHENLGEHCRGRNLSLKSQCLLANPLFLCISVQFNDCVNIWIHDHKVLIYELMSWNNMNCSLRNYIWFQDHEVCIEIICKNIYTYSYIYIYKYPWMKSYLISFLWIHKWIQDHDPGQWPLSTVRWPRA